MSGSGEILCCIFAYLAGPSVLCAQSKENVSHGTLAGLSLERARPLTNFECLVILDRISTKAAHDPYELLCSPVGRKPRSSRDRFELVLDDACAGVCAQTGW